MNKKDIACVSETKRILDTFDLRAKKGFGQNFLIDASIVKRIASIAHAQDAVIEIGPGIGSLTQQLARVSKHVRAYEIDPRLPRVLQHSLEGYDNVEVILQDFLTCDLDESLQELRDRYGNVSICSNLPYYITSPVLFRIFECEKPVEWITVMVQKEVADRFASGPNEKEYGAISVEAQYLYEVKKCFNVPSNCFDPAPKVDSAILQFHLLENARKIDDTKDYFNFVKACFAQRRKTLANNLKPLCKDKQEILNILNRAGVKESARAQELDRDGFLDLYEAYRKECGNS